MLNPINEFNLRTYNPSQVQVAKGRNEKEKLINLTGSNSYLYKNAPQVVIDRIGNLLRQGYSVVLNTGNNSEALSRFTQGKDLFNQLTSETNKTLTATTLPGTTSIKLEAV